MSNKVTLVELKGHRLQSVFLALRCFHVQFLEYVMLASIYEVTLYYFLPSSAVVVEARCQVRASNESESRVRARVLMEANHAEEISGARCSPGAAWKTHATDAEGRLFPPSRQNLRRWRLRKYVAANAA